MAIKFCPQCGAPIAEAMKFGKLRPVCTGCGYVHFSDPKVAVAVFIENGSQVLLVLRGVEPQRGKWALPAGYVDRGEDPAEAARRETEEETGLIVEIEQLLDVMFDGSVIVIIYGARVAGGSLIPQDDVLDSRWFGPQDLPELAFRSTEVLIARWRETLA